MLSRSLDYLSDASKGASQAGFLSDFCNLILYNWYIDFNLVKPFKVILF